MRIGIDAHTLGGHAGGNESYMRMLLHALSAYPTPDDEVIAFVHDAIDYNSVFLNKCLQFYHMPKVSSYVRTPVVLPWLAHKNQLDVLHVQYTAPPYSPCPYVVSMHDVVALRFPETMPWRERTRLRLLSGKTLQHAARIFVLTKAMQRDIQTFYDIPDSRFDLVQPAVEPVFKPVDDDTAKAAVQKKYQLPDTFVLYVGQLQPRKNLIRLAEACNRIKSQGIEVQLVIVGKKAWLYDDMLSALERLNSSVTIHFTGYVSQEDLPILYNMAQVFAFPSLYEGFGIPVLEALACGTPTLISTDPALCEVAGGAALSCDPCDVSAIADTLLVLLTDSDTRERCKKDGPVRASFFSTQRMAKAAFNGYHAIE